MTSKTVFGWLTFDLLLFIALFGIVVWYLDDAIINIVSIGYFELLVLGLATYRIANVIATEKVAKPIRAPFVDEVMKDGEVVEQPKRGGFLGTTGFLIHCPSCTGVWVAAILIYAYFFWPFPTIAFAVILALSGIERLLAHLAHATE